MQHFCSVCVARMCAEGVHPSMLGQTAVLGGMRIFYTPKQHITEPKFSMVDQIEQNSRLEDAQEAERISSSNKTRPKDDATALREQTNYAMLRKQIKATLASRRNFFVNKHMALFSNSHNLKTLHQGQQLNDQTFEDALIYMFDAYADSNTYQNVIELFESCVDANFLKSYNFQGSNGGLALLKTMSFQSQGDAITLPSQPRLYVQYNEVRDLIIKFYQFFNPTQTSASYPRLTPN